MRTVFLILILYSVVFSQSNPSLHYLLPEVGLSFENTEVTISGQNFGVTQGIGTVHFDSVESVNYISWSDTLIICEVPLGFPGFVDVVIKNNSNNSDTLNDGFAYVDEVTPVGEFSFNSDLVNSISGNSLSTEFGTPTYSSDKDGNPNSSLILTQQNHYYIDDINGTELNDFSVSMWLKNSSSNNSFAFAKRNSTRGYFYLLSYTNDLTFPASGTPKNTIPINEWVHIVAVHNDSENLIRIYMDGDQIGTVNINSIPGDHLVIGSFASPYTFNGEMDEFNIFNTAIDTNYIKYLYQRKQPKSLSLLTSISSELNIGDEITLSWTSTSISSVNIELSTDNGASYTPIVSNYNALLGTYSWIAPDFISENSFLRIIDSDGVVSDTSNVFSLNNNIEHFVQVTPTGEEYTIIIEDFSIIYNGIEIGDEIGVFDDTSNGGIGLVGSTKYTGEFPLNIKVQMETTVDTLNIAGAIDGNPIIFKIYDKSLDTELGCSAFFELGGNFGDNPLTIVDHLYGGNNLATTQYIVDDNVLQRFSLPVSLFEPSVSSVFRDTPPFYLEGGNELYLPSIGSDSIDLKDYTVYKVFSHDSARITFSGTKLIPDTSIAIQDSVINYIAYPYTETYTGTQLFGSYPEITYADNGFGGVYIPAYSVDMNIEPNQALKIYTSSDINFTYPDLTLPNKNLKIRNYEYFTSNEFDFNRTGEMYPIIIENLNDVAGKLRNGEIIGVFDNEKCVGTGIYNSSEKSVVIISWLEIESFEIDGAKKGNNISFKLNENNVKLNWSFSKGGTFGAGNYSVATINVENELPNIYTIEQNYPNPFNPSTTIKFSLPETSQVILKVFNLLGEEVKTLINDVKDAGYHEIVFDGSDLSSGVYFYSLNSGEFNSVKKMMLIK